MAKPTAHEQERLLDALRDGAASGDPRKVQRCAIGFAVAGHYTESLRIFRLLLENAPDAIEVRLNLATCLLMAQRIEECSQEISECDRRCRDDDPARRTVEQRAEQLATVRKQVERDVQLLHLKADAYRELISIGKAKLADRKELYRVLVALRETPGGNVTAGEVLAAAEQTWTLAPQDPEAMEFMAYGRMAAGNREGLADMLQRLERVAPHSAVLDLFRGWDTDTGPGKDTDEFTRRNEDIIRRASACDPAAERELRQMCRKYPDDEQLSVGLLLAVYAKAASGRTDYEEARQIVDKLASNPSAGRHIHYHVAQFLWGFGEHDRSRHHFALALRMSKDQWERDSVMKAMQTVGAD